MSAPPVAVMALLMAVAATPARANPNERELALSAAIHDMCGRRLVLLGESGNHGSGETLSFKVDLVRRLVTRCGFSTVLFESSVYDLLELDRRRREREEAGRPLLASAIGQLWAGDREFVPLLDMLQSMTATGRIRVGGLDDGIGSAGAFYSLNAMPDDLTRGLPGDHRTACREALGRRIHYDYPDSRPYSPADKAELIRCIDVMDAAAIAGNYDPALRAERRLMLANLRHAIAPDLGDAADAARERGLAMFANLQWHLARQPRGTKVIVWTATVHAARSTDMDPGRARIDDLGSRVARAYRGRAFVLGFTAAGGSYRQGRRNPPRTMAAAPPGSLEVVALGDRRDVAYVGPAGLSAMGSRSAAMFMPERRLTARWRQALDGVVVFRRERPPIALTTGP